VICLSVCPLDQGEVIAARTAASSFVTPRANQATKLGASAFDPG
jgi:ABC-type methionine transport system ATPase subunit